MNNKRLLWFLKPPGGRLWEVDLSRGIAVLMMILFHFLYDLDYFLGIPTGVHQGFWLVFARATASAFILIAGISITLSASRSAGKPGMAWRQLKRGARILAYGLAITFVTWVALEDGTIWFGILHLIGVSIMLSIPFAGRGSKWHCLGAGMAIIAADFLVEGIQSQTAWLLPLGIKQAGMYMLDYLPLIPWFGVFLIGMFIGGLIYPQGRARLPGQGPRASGPLCWIGRHSLPIYLLHQPVLTGLILLLSSI